MIRIRIAILLTLLLASTAAKATIYDVTNASELTTALGSASSGDTIRLASGNYGSRTFTQDYAGYVTLISLDPENPGTFTDVEFDNAAYIRLDSIHIDYPSNPATNSFFSPAHIELSDNIQIINSEINALVDSNYLGGNGMRPINSTNILIENNYIHDVKWAIYSQSGSGIIIKGNRVENIRSDTFRVDVSNNITIENNTGPRFIHPESGDHTDFVQFAGNADGITIRGNVSLPGEDHFSQGIFIDDFTYSDVLIENNVIMCGNYNKIVVRAATGVTVRKNTVLSYPDFGHPDCGFEISNSTGVINENNVICTSGSTGSVGTNVITQYSNPANAVYYNDVYLDAMAGGGITLEDMAPVPGGPAACGSGVGAEERICALLGAAGEPTPVPSISYGGGIWP